MKYLKIMFTDDDPVRNLIYGHIVAGLDGGYYNLL